MSPKSGVSESMEGQGPQIDDNLDDLGRNVTDHRLDPKHHPQIHDDKADAEGPAPSSDKSYRAVEVESYHPENATGLHGPLRVRALPGQQFTTDLRVECPRKMTRDYPAGTRFRVRAKLREGDAGKPFLWVKRGSTFEVITRHSSADPQ